MSNTVPSQAISQPLIVRNRYGIQVLENVHGLFHGRFVEGNSLRATDFSPEGKPYFLRAELFSGGNSMHAGGVYLATFYTEQAMLKAVEIAANTFANVVLFGVPSRTDNLCSPTSVDRDLSRDMLVLDLRELEIEGYAEFQQARELQEALDHQAELAKLDQTPIRERVISLDDQAVPPTTTAPVERQLTAAENMHLKRVLRGLLVPRGAQVPVVPFNTLLNDNQLAVLREAGMPSEVLAGTRSVDLTHEMTPELSRLIQRSNYALV